MEEFGSTEFEVNLFGKVRLARAFLRDGVVGSVVKVQRSLRKSSNYTLQLALGFGRKSWMQHMQFVVVARLCVVQERKHGDNSRNDVVFVKSEENRNHLLVILR